MKRSKFIGGGVLAVAALLVILPTSGAMAAKKTLILKEAGAVAPVGASALIFLVLDECSVFTEATLKSNNAAKDVVAGSKLLRSKCLTGRSESGLLTEVSMPTSGKASAKGTVTVTEPGPCAYQFSKFKGEMEIPGETVFSGTSTGKLNKKLSAKTGCAKTITPTFVAGAADAEEELFEAEL
jgi:hypothetical protein